MKLDEHPTVQHVRAQPGAQPEPAPPLDAQWLRRLCLEAGADDVGFVDLDRPELAGERPHVLAAFPRTRTLATFVLRMQRENIRSPARSLANKEFHAADHDVTDVSRRIVARLAEQGVAAVHTAFGFPMEADRWPGRMWVVSHKLVAEAAGLGRIGLHRNLIHPEFGSFVFLGTVLIERPVATETTPLDFNPCLDCRLCVSACPVGAISQDGRFDFSACYTHNYREFMGGFEDYVETVAEAGSRAAFRAKVKSSETVSMWQSLSFGANYKAAYCIAACPAGADVIGPFLADRGGFVREVVRPLQQKEEPVYVVPGSDAAAHVARRFPHKTVRPVRNSLRPQSVEGFVRGLPLVFQPGKAGGVDATYHFLLRRADDAPLEVTVVIRDRNIDVRQGLHGAADLRVVADGAAWLRFLGKRSRLPWYLLTRRIRLRGSPRHLLAFGRCFL